MLGFSPGEEVVGAIFDGSVTDGSIEFVHEFLVAIGIFEEVVEHGREAYGGSFGAGESHTDGHGEDAAIVKEIGAVFFRFEKHGEEVAAANEDGLFGIHAVDLGLMDFGEAFRHASFGKADNREGERQYAIAIEKAEDGVLIENEIENWDLANLRKRA